MWVAFAFAKATHIFFSKTTCELDIVLTRTVSILATNELVKLTMLWTTGPWLSIQKKTECGIQSVCTVCRLLSILVYTGLYLVYLDT